MAYPHPHYGDPGNGLPQAMNNLHLSGAHPPQYQFQQHQQQPQQYSQQYSQPQQQQYQQPQFPQGAPQHQQYSQPQQHQQQQQLPQYQHQQQIPPQQGPIPNYVTLCDPVNLSTSVGFIPPNPNMLQNAPVPLAVLVRPLAEAAEPPTIVNFGAAGVVRCKPCRAYINPYVTFFDGGAKWKCSICGKPNEVGANYFSKLGANGLRADIQQRPELMNSTIEIIAPQEYMVRQPMPPIFLFLIDVSVNAVRSGFVKTIAETIRESLDELPGNPRTKVGFMTFDSTVHFYGLNPDTSSPQMFVLSDLSDIFLPQPDHLLVNLEESREHIETFLDSLAQGMHGGTEDVESALGPALEGAGKLLLAEGGKLSVFLSALPCLGIGKLANRENPQLMGTEKEHTLLLPADDYYKQFAITMTSKQIGMNLYVCANSFSDVATIGDITTFTGGEIHFFKGGFEMNNNCEKLKKQLRKDLTRLCGWEAVVRIRVSKGLELTSYSGHFTVRGNDLLGLPIIDCDKTITVELKLDETGITEPTVLVQSALLYTTSTGERRIRVHNLCVPIAQNPAQVLSNVDLCVVTAVISKRAAYTVLEKGFTAAREYINKVCTNLLRAIKQYSVSRELWEFASVALGMIKSPAFRQGVEFLSPDTRAYILSWVRLLGVDLLTYFKPNLFELLINDNDPKKKTFAQPVNLSANVLKNDGIFVLDDGFEIFIRVGREVPIGVLQDIFGVQRFSEAKSLREPEPNETGTLAEKMKTLCTYLFDLGPQQQALRILRQGEANELEFLQRLIEDRIGNAMSLSEFLNNLGMQGGPQVGQIARPQQHYGQDQNYPPPARPQQYPPESASHANQPQFPSTNVAPIRMHLPSAGAAYTPSTSSPLPPTHGNLPYTHSTTQGSVSNIPGPSSVGVPGPLRPNLQPLGVPPLASPPFGVAGPSPGAPLGTANPPGAKVPFVPSQPSFYQNGPTPMHVPSFPGPTGANLPLSGVGGPPLPGRAQNIPPHMSHLNPPIRPR